MASTSPADADRVIEALFPRRFRCAIFPISLVTSGPAWQRGTQNMLVVGLVGG